MEFIKNIVCEILKQLQRLLFLVPVNNRKILFFPYNGTYYCNLKYIYENLKYIKDKYEVVWVIRDNSLNDGIANAVVCRPDSIKFLWHSLTSKCVVFNCGFKSYVYKRKSQKYIETWHGGGAYKKTSQVFKNTEDRYLRKRRMNAINSIDYVISSSKAFTKVFKEDTDIQNAKFCPFGMPRNDMFFDDNRRELIKNNVKKYYNVNSEKIVLYAPTFRDNDFENDLDFERLLSVLEDRYGSKFVLFLRCHPHITTDIFDKYRGYSNIIDVSEYTDMQELLCASDILITDYSSCMWDFSLMFRPCFIYANDVADYKEERNFHTPMSEWPFPIATNNEELEQNIMDFDEISYKEAVENHHKALGSYEDGHASERVCKLIEEICLGKE